MPDLRNPMTHFYSRLSEIGYPKKYVRDMILPSWWDDGAAESPAGFAEAALIVARRLGLDYASLRSGEGTVQSSPRPQVKFKTAARGTVADECSVAAAIAMQTARFAALGAPEPSLAPLKTAAEIREHIKSDRPCVDLEGLIDYCWSIGIVVLHVSQLPPGAKRLHGLAVNANGRHVAVVFDGRSAPAYSLFVLAHELGHINLGHVGEGGALVDNAINAVGLDDASDDKEELEANRFALELVTGRPDFRVRAADRWLKADALAAEAQRIGREKGIDPGHIVLNYAHTMGGSFFAVANAALKHLDPAPDAVGLVRRKLAERLDWSELPPDAAEFVARVTALAEPDAAESA